jgi:hypothetical protein
MSVPLLPACSAVYHWTGPYKEAGMEPETDTRELPDAARRALAEAEARRKAAQAQPPLAVELGGRDGPEPVRFGDWERRGIAVDF